LLDEKEMRANIDSEKSVEILNRHVLGARRLRHACVRDENVQPVANDTAKPSWPGCVPRPEQQDPTLLPKPGNIDQSRALRPPSLSLRSPDIIRHSSPYLAARAVWLPDMISFALTGGIL
jgi:hypothetical protein